MPRCGRLRVSRRTLSPLGKADLNTLVVPQAADAAEAPAAYVTGYNPGPTGRVVYRGTDNHIHELYYLTS